MTTEASGRDWLDMPPVAFDATAPNVPLALFAEPDRLGTLDLFDTTEGESA